MTFLDDDASQTTDTTETVIESRGVDGFLSGMLASQHRTRL